MGEGVRLRPPDISESEFQAQVEHMAVMYGWDFMHVSRATVKDNRWLTPTRGTLKHWPDLTLVKAGHRPIVAELKRRGETPTEEQRKVLQALAAGGFDAYVWWPGDLDDLAVILRQPA